MEKCCAILVGAVSFSVTSVPLLGVGAVVVCTQKASPSVVLLMLALVPLSVMVWLDPGVPTVLLLKFCTMPNTQLLLAVVVSDSEGVAALVELYMAAAPVCVVDAPVKTTGWIMPAGFVVELALATVKFAVMVMLVWALGQEAQ